MKSKFDKRKQKKSALTDEDQVIASTLSKPNKERQASLNVFVSHSTLDREFVEREILPILIVEGTEVFYSPESIVPADQWERMILKGLKKCDAFLLVMSPRSAQSPWVKREVDWIFHKGGKTVIPILLDDCDGDDFHIGMVSIQYVDFSKDRKDGRKKLQQLWKNLRQLGPSLE